MYFKIHGLYFLLHALCVFRTAETSVFTPVVSHKKYDGKKQKSKKSIKFVVSKPKPPHRDERKYRFEQQKTVHNHTGI